MNGVIKKTLTQNNPVVDLVMAVPMTIDASAVDSGNPDGTHILRPGLVLGKISASGKLKDYWIDYDSGTDTSDGSETAYAILLNEVDLKDGDPTGTATDHEAMVMLYGVADPNKCFNYDAAAKTDLESANRIFFRS